MDDIFLSVIIPVYNEKKYLHQCVDSVLANRCDELEIILVDDGSTDGSGSICDDYSQKYGCIHALHKNNGGLVSARKAGAKKARGTYLTFVDSDDYVDVDLYDSVITVLKDSDDRSVEILISAYKSEGAIFENNISNGIYTKKDIERIIIPGILTDEAFGTKMIPAVWVKYFPTEVFNECMNCVDDAIRDGEDQLFSLVCLMHISKVQIRNDIVGYNYRIVAESMSHEFNRAYYDNASVMCNCMNRIIERSEYSEELVEPVMYTGAYMYYRYVDHMLFDNKNVCKKERYKALRLYMKSTIMGKAFMQMNVSNMNVSFMMKFELKLLQKSRFSETYWLRRFERLVHR